MNTTDLPVLVFDLDGTLVDSAPDMNAAANRILTSAGRSGITLAQTRGFIGDGVPRFVERIFAATGTMPPDDIVRSETARFLADYELNAAVLTRPYPGVATTLSMLQRRGHRLAVCTNKPQTASDGLLAGLDLSGFFELVGAGDRYPVRKPDPGHLIGLLNEMDCASGHAVMIGDNENDAETARAAGVRFVLMSYGYARTPIDEIPADARFSAFSELLDFVT